MSTKATMAKDFLADLYRVCNKNRALLFGFVLLSLLLVFLLIKNSGPQHPVAVAGEIVVDDKMLSESVVLDGEWFYFDRELIQPGEISERINSLNNELLEKRLVDMPDRWHKRLADINDIEDTGKGFLPGTGYATYAVKITKKISSDDVPILGLKTGYTYTSASYYVIDAHNNNEHYLVTSVGQPATDAENTVARSITNIALMPETESEEFWLVMHVASFTHRKGGVSSPPEIAELSKLEQNYYLLVLSDFLVFGFLLLIAINNFALFLQYRNHYSSLFLSMISIFLIVRVLVVEGYIDIIFPEAGFYTYELHKIIEYSTLPWITLAGMLYINSKWSGSIHRSVFWVVVITPFMTMIYFSFNSLYVVSQSLPAIQVYMVATIIYYIFAISYNLKASGKSEIRNFIIAIFIFCFASILDVLSAYGVGLPVFVFHYVFCIVIYGASQELGREFANALQASEKLSLELQGAIDEKTKELLEKNEALNDAHESLKRLSSVDGMTGLSNRGYFNDQIAYEWSQSIRSKSSISIIMIDIDYFKRINDTHGHLCGDHCIKEVSNLLRVVFSRKIDIVARYGGEEFTVVLPMIESAEALVKSEDLRKKVEEKSILYNDQTIPLTISLGVCTCKASMEGDVNGFIGAADKALYRSKSNGRNQTTVGEYLI